MKKRGKYVFVALLAPLFMFGTMDFLHRRATMPFIEADTLLLLLPDSIDFSTTPVQQWLDVAREEGLHLQPIHDSEFLNPLTTTKALGVILPDQLHRTANDVLIGELYSFVRRGGSLMVVYDACTWDLNGRFPPGGSRLSTLVGVRYGLYDQYQTQTMEPAEITGTSAAMRELAIPPGSFVRVDEHGKQVRWRQIAKPAQDDAQLAFAAYQYGVMKYSIFRTAGDFNGTVLLQARSGIAAGYRQDGLGEVLFVNLPLGYLASRTDGLLLHSFLHFFAVEMLHLPYLTSVPDGVGGLVFNWHIDASSSLKPLKILADEGVFDHGRFSVHFTAGPDVDAFGDHKGLDILHNPEAQKWIRYLVARGQLIGSHGGWIHNYFGYHLDDTNEKRFEPYLEMNKEALERISGAHITEYSAPVGNHPAWVTRWLEHHGFTAYYFTGDAGLGPTRVYRDGQPDAPGIWAFPILHLGKEASLEEMGFEDVPLSAVHDWLLSVTDFTVRQHTARLVYTHPYGAERFFATLRSWLENAGALQQEGRFRWYTMSELAEFLNHRNSIRWSLVRSSVDKIILRAVHPEDLGHETWAFPHAYYGDGRVMIGQVNLRVQDGMLFITANGGKQMEVEITLTHGQRTPKTLEARR